MKEYSVLLEALAKIVRHYSECHGCGICDEIVEAADRITNEPWSPQ